MNHHLIDTVRLARAATLGRLDRIGRHPSTDARSSIARIDDPHGQAVILSVRGLLDARSLYALWDEAEQLGDITSVDFDLTDTVILPGPWMDELEAFVDALEDAGVDVRVAGIDPHHPALG